MRCRHLDAIARERGSGGSGAISTGIQRRKEPRRYAPLNNLRHAREREDAMICRIWHGWTTSRDADAYEALLRSEIFPWIENRHLAGFHGIQLLRRPLEESVEFVTIMWFDS